MLTLKIMWDEPRQGIRPLFTPNGTAYVSPTGELTVTEATTNRVYEVGREFMQDGSPDHFASRTRWITDVTAVEILDRMVYNSWAQARNNHGRDVFGYTWLWDGDEREPVRGPFGPNDPPRDVGLTLILVATRDASTDGLVLLVERAWLLGPDGQTVDRVAP